MQKKADIGAIRRLALDGLTTKLPLAQRLPRELAYRYHALPVAEDGDRITVVIADPDDPEAAGAIAAVLGNTPYLVQSDRQAIDALLEQIWPVEDQLRLLACAPPGSDAEAVWHCTQALSELLGAQVSSFEPAGDLGALAAEVARAGYDLIIFGEPCQSLVAQLVFGPINAQVARHIPTSLLATGGFRWPLCKILLVVQHEKGNDIALEWTVRLACPSGAAVTILLVVPPVPAMYGKQGRMRQGLTALLSSNTPLGQEMRRLGCRLENERIEGTLRLRQGAAIRQLQLEIAIGDYDLIIVSADSTRWWRRWLTGEQVNSLLRWAGRPVLIAKPTTA